MDSKQFIDELRQVSLSSVFNPYRDVCRIHDHSESPAIRRLNLQLYLDKAVECGMESVWLGRDIGYRGGRRTGIALTDEIHLEILERHFGIAGMTKTTIGESFKEQTSTEVWKIIREVDAKVFLWNIFPFHPFKAGNSMSNRRHTTREFNECKDLLICLLQWLKPKKNYCSWR